MDVRKADPHVKEDILTPWIVFWAIAAIVSMAALYVAPLTVCCLSYSTWALQGAEGAGLLSPIT